jgi:hypothetical protein
VVAAVVPWSVVEAAARWEDLRLGRMAEAVRRADRDSGEPPVPLAQLVEELDAASGRRGAELVVRAADT